MRDTLQGRVRTQTHTHSHATPSTQVQALSSALSFILTQSLAVAWGERTGQSLAEETFDVQGHRNFLITWIQTF